MLHLLQMDKSVVYQRISCSINIFLHATFFVKFAKSSTSQRISCSTKRATFFGLLYFQMLLISIITISMYAISRTIQNPSFNTPYDVTTRIKSLICKITRFYMKIFTTGLFLIKYGILKHDSDFKCVFG